MEIKVDDLKNYAGLPVFVEDMEEWHVIKSITYTEHRVIVICTDKYEESIDRGAEHTGIFISV